MARMNAYARTRTTDNYSVHTALRYSSTCSVATYPLFFSSRVTFSLSFLFLIVIVQASFSRWKIALSPFVCFQNPIFEFVSWYHFHLSPGVESRWLHLMYTSFNYKMGLSFLLADSSSCKGFLFAYVNYVLLPTPSWKFQTIWFLYITVM